MSPQKIVSISKTKIQTQDNSIPPHFTGQMAILDVALLKYSSTLTNPDTNALTHSTSIPIMTKINSQQPVGTLTAAMTVVTSLPQVISPGISKQFTIQCTLPIFLHKIHGQTSSHGELLNNQWEIFREIMVLTSILWRVLMELQIITISSLSLSIIIR